MRVTKRLLVASAATALAASGALATSSAASASETTDSSSSDGVHIADTTVTARDDIPVLNVRDDPRTNATLDRQVAPGGQENGECWLYGEEVTEFGVTSNIWVDIGDPPLDYEYVWAGGLKGDATGGVPNQC